MNYQKLNRLSGLYFWVILTIGLLYFSSIVWLFFKTYAGTSMLAVYLFDSKKYGYSLEDFKIMPTLWVTLSFWLLSLLLILRTITSLIRTSKMILKTRNFILNLKILSRKNNKVIFDSDSGEIFTAGLFFPQIYIASGLRKLHTTKEVKAMLLHEQNHVKSKDPLKTSIVAMVSGSLPYFPGKPELIKHFYTLVEVSADKRAEERLKNKLPLVSALRKRLEIGNKMLSAGISYFNSQSERIGILVGVKKLNKNLVYAVGYVTVVGFLMFSYLATKIDFYNCPHLSLCWSSVASVMSLH